jgi:superfamily II DNA/RNA helicase
VGTPGRVVELIKARKLKMHEVRTIVADEADQLVSMSTIEDVKQIFKSALRDRQIAFFSATVTPDVQRIADRWMSDPVVIAVQPEHRTAETIEHLFVECEERDKVEWLRRLYRTLQPKSALVFLNEIEPIAELVSKLEFANIPVAALYGDAPKQERTKVLGRFREGKIRLLIATDVAARGLDIPDITHVFHLDPATDADHYVHRVGRTGRMGKSGVAISIITNREAFILRKFEEQLGIQIQRRVLSEGKLLRPEQLRSNISSSARISREATASRAKPPGSESFNNIDRRNSNSDSRQASNPDLQTRKSQSSNGASVSSIQNSATAEQKAALNSARSKDRQRERDKKNKGAPKWLKAKKEQGSDTPTQ